MLRHVAEPARTGPGDRSEGDGGIVDVELRERSARRRLERFAFAPGCLRADERREQEHDPQIRVGVGDARRRRHPVGDQLPDTARASAPAAERVAEHERRAHHVGVGRVGEVVGRRDVAGLCRRYLEQARELDVMLEQVTAQRRVS